MRRLLLSLSVVLCLTAAACGGDDDEPTVDGAEQSDGGDGPYPVTVTHAEGETTFEERPERIVSLNVQWTDALLALDVEPTGFVLDAGSLETDIYPWQEGLLDDAERIDVTGTVPYEAIAALEPDLILVTYAATQSGVYDQLSTIAPTIGLLGDLEVDPWEDQVELLGEVLGEEDAAADVIAGVDAEVAALAEELPELQGKTYAMVNYVAGDALYIVANPEDGAGRLFADLGMAIAPEILALDTNAIGRVQASLEQAGVLESDFIAILANGADPAELIGWNDLTGVQTGAVVNFEFADVVGLNTPSPLSIPHVLDIMRPALEKAAAAA